MDGQNSVSENQLSKESLHLSLRAWHFKKKGGDIISATFTQGIDILVYFSEPRNTFLQPQGGGGGGELTYIGIQDVPFFRVLFRLENKFLSLFYSL